MEGRRWSIRHRWAGGCQGISGLGVLSFSGRLQAGRRDRSRGEFLGGGASSPEGLYCKGGGPDGHESKAEETAPATPSRLSEASTLTCMCLPIRLSRRAGRFAQHDVRQLLRVHDSDACPSRQLDQGSGRAV